MLPCCKVNWSSWASYRPRTFTVPVSAIFVPTFCAQRISPFRLPPCIPTENLSQPNSSNFCWAFHQRLALCRDELRIAELLGQGV